MKTSTKKNNETYNKIATKIEELELIAENLTKEIEELKECLKKINPLEYPKTFESKENLKIWLNENGVKYKLCYIFDNGNWSYTDKQGLEHLFRNGKELTKGLKAVSVYSYDNGDWSYYDKQYHEHFFRNGEELTKGLKAVNVWSYGNGNWAYIDEAGKRYDFDKDNNPI